jgi:hypothetical protein
VIGKKAQPNGGAPEKYIHMMCGYCKTLFIGCEVIGKGAHEKDIHMKCGYCKTLTIGCEVIGKSIQKSNQ